MELQNHVCDDEDEGVSAANPNSTKSSQDKENVGIVYIMHAYMGWNINNTGS